MVTISCNSANVKEGLKKIDFSKAPLKDVDFREIPKESKFVPLRLPDSVYLGKIETIRFTDKYMVLHDRELAKALYVFDHEGNYIGRLKRHGEAEGEYLSLYAFAVSGGNVYVYDRRLGNIVKYTFPEFDLVSSQSMNIYLTEMVGTGKGFMGISDDFEEEGYYYGQLFYDEDFQLISNIKKRPGIIEATESTGFSTDDTGELYYSEPLSEMVYKMDGKILKEQYLIDFGSHGIPTEVAEFSDAEDFYELLSEGHYFFAAHNFNRTGSIVSVNFYNQDIEPQLQGLYDFKTEKGMIIKDLGEVTDYVIAPISVQQGYNIALLYPDEYSRETLRLLGMKEENLDSIDISKPVIYKYRYVKMPS
ncbi:6-bladed beta-propeller [Echinicola strongylocentroti]|uniref:6-bladed beta-propeller n=1 Tax=Echinicola strongylocentroti TaxID=1795355 RepID=UPI0013A6ECA6|nr:6-bladed beta-propeller [Echinicola strongylocentroti]